MYTSCSLLKSIRVLRLCLYLSLKPLKRLIRHSKWGVWVLYADLGSLLSRMTCSIRPLKDTCSVWRSRAQFCGGAYVVHRPTSASIIGELRNPIALFRSWALAWLEVWFLSSAASICERITIFVSNKNETKFGLTSILASLVDCSWLSVKIA